MTLAALAQAAGQRHLAIRGAFHPRADQAAPEGCKTLVLLGPDEPGFWAAFKASGEFADGLPDPMDRWSKRMIRALAARFDGSAVFPSDGPPYPAFISWALASGENWASPVGLLVHEHAGLFVSFRGALALPERLELGAAPRSPCVDCDAPCLTACPAGAMGAAGYDVPKCKTHTAGKEGAPCRRGCLVRRACPASQGLDRDPEQSAFHMAAFLGIPFAPD